MQINEWAEKLLFTDHWQEKLFEADSLKYTDSYSEIAEVDTPGRPINFSSCKQNPTFPSKNDLVKDHGKAQALHYFANHELLAIETMAYTLLRFPKTPLGFKKGLVSTIHDEQKHLKLYIDRMQELGVQFGDLPLNDFFWKNLKNMNSGLDFVVRMSLTFEQANLDFSLQYMKFFSEHDDQKTADILKTVYEDEIRHVRHGLHWFDQWRPNTKSRWQEFSELLPYPLTPQRGKGKYFSIPARKKAGLDDDFIEKMQLFSASKGRVPKVYYFHCDVEEEWANAGYNRSQKIQKLNDDLSFVPAYLALASDILLIPKIPSDSFLKNLVEAGFSLPEIVSSNSLDSLTPRYMHSVEPWGRRPQTLPEEKKWSLKQPTVITDCKELFSKKCSTEKLRLFLKDFPSALYIEEQDVGVFVDSIGDIQRTVSHFLKRHEKVVIKSLFGASGRHLRILSSQNIDPATTNGISKLIQQQGGVIVEPWLNKVFDFSLHFSKDVSKSIRLHGMTRFLTDKRGAYLGSIIQDFNGGLSQEVLSFLHKKTEGHSLMSKYCDDIKEFFEEAFVSTNSSNFSIDAFVYENACGELKLKPMVEMNYRYTMGRVSFEAGRKLNLPGCGLWIQISKPFDEASLNDNGFELLKRDFFDRKNFYYLPVTNSLHREHQFILFWGSSFGSLKEKCLNMKLLQH